ncbi:MAG: hypothetical protein BroJett030_08420 [Alphaproteobacteria bacterium]|nr:MAG: hypothetical protein BroJett030_08420 [Alphaproteobacteria bacterium]
MKTIVAATDFSQRSVAAIDRAAALAAATGAALLVVHAVDDSLPRPVVERRLAEANDMLAEQSTMLERVGGRHEVASGDVFLAIHRAASAAHADLVVVGDHRRGVLRDIISDTTVERLIRVSAVPVLIARTAGAPPYQHALAGVESMEGPELLEALASFGSDAPARTTLLHAIDTSATGLMYYAGIDRQAIDDYRAEVARQARARLTAQIASAPLMADIAIVDDPPAVAITRHAQESGCDLVVVSSHARRIVARGILGSVSSHLIRRGITDLLIVPRVVSDAVP